MEWISVEDGQILRREPIASHGYPVMLASPEFTDTMANSLLKK